MSESKGRQISNFVSSKTGIAVTVSGDPVVIGVGNTQTVTITGSGRIGIGYTTPNAKLHIGGTAAAQGDATNPALQIGGSTTYRLGLYTENEAGVIDNANGDNGIRFVTKNTSESVRIDADGKVSISTAVYAGGGPTPELYVRGTSGRQVKFHNPNNSTISLQFSNAQTGEGEDAGTQLFVQGTTGNFGIYNTYSTGDIVAYTNSQPRLYILENGYVGVNVSDPANQVEIVSSTIPLRMYRQTATTTVGGVTFFSDVGGTESQRFEIAADGDVFNSNNSYGTLSDIKLKQDITNAGSQWDDIKQLRFVNYRLKSEVSHEVGIGSTLGYTAPRLLGLVAQEVELISPGLISHRDDIEIKNVPVLDKNGVQALHEDGSPKFRREEVLTGTTTKAIKTSVLQMKVAKALQEAIEKIEILQEKVASLESQVGIAST